MAEKKVIEIEIKDNSKSLKAQYKEAVLEVQKLADAFGETSIEVANAAKKAAELKDKIEDVNDAIQAQKGEGAFIALGKSISTVANGFSAVQGAMGLVGVESEEVQQAMLRVQSAMALAQGLEGLEDAGRAFKQLGAVVKSTTIFTSAYNFVVYGTTTATKAQTIATNIQTGATTATTTATKILRIAMLSLPILAIVAGLAALADAMGAFGDKTETAEEKQAKLDKQLAKTTEEIDRQKTASEKSAEFMDALNKEEIINAKNRGASEKELTKIKNEQTKKRLKDLKQEYDEATKFMLKTSKTFTDRKQIDAAEELFNQAFKKYNDFRLEVEGDTADEIYEKRKTAVDKANQLRNSELEKIKELNKNAKEQNEARLRTEQEQEEFLINDKYKSQIALFKKNGKDTKELEIAKLNEINDVRLKYQKITDDAEKERKQKELNVINEANKLRIQQEQEFQSQMEEIDEDNFQKGLQKTMTEDEYQLELVRQKYFTLEELAKDNAEQLAIIETAKALEIEEIDKKSKEKQIANENELRQKRLQLAGQAFTAIGDIIGAFTAKNDKDARKQFQIQKAFNLAAAVTNTAMAVTGALTAGGNPIKLATGMQFVEAGIAAATGAVNIAKIASAKFGGGGGGGDTGAPPAIGGVVAPNLNVVGDTGINQLATLQQQPVKAYVVSNDVTSAQQFDMKVQQTAQI
jgi:enamine deaminase RidA (YjgF/YER057c/UK114 family)